MNGFLARFSRSVPPFPTELRITLIVADPVAATVIARSLRSARAKIDTRTQIGAKPDTDIVLLDLKVPQAWDWMQTYHDQPVIALVDDESIGLQALRHGADGILNLQTVQAPEVVGLIARLTRTFSPTQTCSKVREHTARILNSIESFAHRA